jgi:uncharacterized protein with HEPN domain
MSPSLLDFLQHILSECSFVIRNTKEKSKEETLEDEVLTRALVRSLEIIGEATKKLPIDFRNQYPQVNWEEMAGMRDVLIHDYFGIDYDVVWNTVKYDIPELQNELERIIDIES